MKVRQRLFPNEVFEVLAESPNHYILKGPAMSLAGAWTSDGELFAPKTMWEPVPPPDRWQDVTGDVVESYGLLKGQWHYKRPESVKTESGIVSSICDSIFPNLLPKGYRLRKVQVSDIQFGNTDGTVTVRRGLHWAFIVERKVSE